LRGKARENVGRAAGLERDDDAHRPARPSLRPCAGGPGRERGRTRQETQTSPARRVHRQRLARHAIARYRVGAPLPARIFLTPTHARAPNLVGNESGDRRRPTFRLVLRARWAQSLPEFDHRVARVSKDGAAPGPRPPARASGRPSWFETPRAIVHDPWRVRDRAAPHHEAGRERARGGSTRLWSGCTGRWFHQLALVYGADSDSF
jgi:hypothetical protein